MTNVCLSRLFLFILNLSSDPTSFHARLTADDVKRISRFLSSKTCVRGVRVNRSSVHCLLIILKLTQFLRASLGERNFRLEPWDDRATFFFRWV